MKNKIIKMCIILLTLVSVSFPLVGNLSCCEERCWASQHDKVNTLNFMSKLMRPLIIPPFRKGGDLE
jgi:hypothetical protein